jgi:hypothetical protein
MKQIFTKEMKDNLMKELERIETQALKGPIIAETYFPHTLYEVSSVLDKAIGQEIEYKDTEF